MIMDYSKKFLRIMHDINDAAKEKGYFNGKDWADAAMKNGKISQEDLKEFKRFHELRNCMAHNDAEDISISERTYQAAEKFYSKIKNENQQKTRKEIKLPEGCFRQETFEKEFQWRGKDGKIYDFKFSIINEENLIDDGSKSAELKKGTYKDGVSKASSYAKGFFIHILKAPQYSYAKNDPHKFHIIINPSGSDYICWDRKIDSFQEANAVMRIWVEQYVNLLLEERKNNTENLSVSQCDDTTDRNEYLEQNDNIKENEIDIKNVNTQKKKGLFGRLFGR